MNGVKTIILIITIILILVACGLRTLKAPSPEVVDIFISKHHKEIEIVNNYLLGLDGLDASISGINVSILVELKEQTIEDDCVIDAIKTLWRNGCVWITKYIDDNAITYVIWKRTYDEAEGGFVFAIDYDQKPKVQFQTEMVPLTDSGCYYYLAEYNKWRAGERFDNLP